MNKISILIIILMSLNCTIHAKENENKVFNNTTELLSFNDFNIAGNFNKSDLKQEAYSVFRVYYDYPTKSNKKLEISHKKIILNNIGKETFIKIKNKSDNTAIITEEIYKKGYTTEQLVDFYILKKNSLQIKQTIKKDLNIFNFIVLKISE